MPAQGRHITDRAIRIALGKGDPEEGSILRDTARQVLASVLPGD